MKKIDCCGDMCPIPLLKLKTILNKTPEKEPVMIITDHSCVLESINEYLDSKHYKYKIIEVLNGVWEITVSNR